MAEGMIDTSVAVGSVTLRNPVMTASGTAGYGTEFGRYLPLDELGAVVTKSIAAYEWAGNPAPRLHPIEQGMMNAVGLQGPGIDSWLRNQVPQLIDAGATIVCSIWGRSLDDYRQAAQLLAAAPPEVVAVEVNLSCPNLAGHGIFAHDADLSAAVIEATAVCDRPRWAKLSPNTDRVVDIAGAVSQAGADAVTLTNTLLGLALDPDTLEPTLGNGGGGVSGRVMHPIVVRIVNEVRKAHPDLPIVGVGGIATGWDAAELMIAGADAVQVGTATFADPRACAKVLAQLVRFAERRDIPHFGAFPRLA